MSALVRRLLGWLRRPPPSPPSGRVRWNDARPAAGRGWLQRPPSIDQRLGLHPPGALRRARRWVERRER